MSHNHSSILYSVLKLSFFLSVTSPDELSVTRCLCHLYECKIPNQVQWIIYSQHQVQLLRRTGYREQEGEALEAISQIYLSIGTEQYVHVDLQYDWNMTFTYLLCSKVQCSVV